MKVAIDMDGILADLLPAWLSTYNGAWDDSIDVEDIGTWNVHEHVKDTCGTAVYEILEESGFFDGLPPIPGAIPAVTALKGSGHEVVICTASANADSARAKVEWVIRHLGHLGMGRRDMFIAHKKHWIGADVLIDDSPNNIRKWTDTGRPAMTIAYPYNESVRDLCEVYADGYRDTLKAWDEIVRHLGVAT